MDLRETLYLGMRKVVETHLEVQALIQDILSCTDSVNELKELNEEGLVKIEYLRSSIDRLTILARTTLDENIIMEVDSQQQQLASTMKHFKEANIRSLIAIENKNRNDLLPPVENIDTVRHRKHNRNTDKNTIIEKSSHVTDRLLSVSRHLADTTQKSQDILDSLTTSSSIVHGTQSELENTAGSINQSSKLLKKYARREFTDKIIMFFAFCFFIAVCLYIVHKRL